MILVKPDAIDDKIGLIHIPEGILKSGEKPGDYMEGFIGTIVATGPGDPLLTLKCGECGTHRKRIVQSSFGGTRTVYKGMGKCGHCQSSAYTVTHRGHAAMETKIGDRVVFPRRPSSPGGEYSVDLEGEKYILMHEEQSAMAVLEA